MPLNVCVYASASSRTSERFMQEGRRLGRLIAERGHTLINGGGKLGGMGALNDGCHAAGGRVVCVIHEMFVVDGVEFSEADEMVVAGGDDLGERKRLLAERCDAIVVMPGDVRCGYQTCFVYHGTRRGAAAGATWIIRGRVAAAPRAPRG